MTVIFGLLAPLPASAGSVTGVTVSTPKASVNTSISVTVLGSNPCGAAHVNWGDGTAITYAITGLPSSIVVCLHPVNLGVFLGVSIGLA